MLTFELQDTQATEQFGAKLFQCLPNKCLVFLHGDLGMGKTTLVRGFLRAAGHAGAVKSPTYNIVEEYQLHARRVLHFDLYRIADAEELEWIGIRDYLAQDSVCFIEWPEKGEEYLPIADLDILFKVNALGRRLQLHVLNVNLQGIEKVLQAS